VHRFREQEDDEHDATIFQALHPDSARSGGVLGPLSVQGRVLRLRAEDAAHQGPPAPRIGHFRGAQDQDQKSKSSALSRQMFVGAKFYPQH
jgi:hypothetical protein